MGHSSQALVRSLIGCRSLVSRLLQCHLAWVLTYPFNTLLHLKILEPTAAISSVWRAHGISGLYRGFFGFWVQQWVMAGLLRACHVIARIGGCSVCAGISMILLPCGHRMCGVCVEQMLDLNTALLECPMCNEQLPRNSIRQQLLRDFHVW